ncbi:MAG: peptide ABC transporter substrate-binding protein [Cellulosilyticaceae bacterium]
MVRKKIAKVLAIMLAATLALSGCSGSGGGSEVKKEARLVSGGEPGSLHPATAQGTHESIILDHIFEGLMKRDETGKVVPGMAKDYKISDDKLTYTFTLRDDAKWSNGDPVTAGDFEYSWKYALNPNTASNYAYQLYYLEGGEAFNTADTASVSADDLKALEDKVGVKAVDDHTLEVKLSQPTPYFLELCAFYTYYPIDQKVQEENPDWATDGATFVCNGPFMVTEWNHDQNVKVVKNDNYYNKDKVNLTDITFNILEDQNTAWQMYQNNEIDVDFDLPTEVLGQLRAENNVELKVTPELSTYFYRFNTTVKPFNNVKVRKALTMAINRQELIDNVTLGGQFPAYALVPSVPDAKGDFRENGGNYITENLDGAKQLLAEGLKEEGMDTLSFTILYNTSEAHKKIAEAIQQMWKKLGVDVQLENTEFRVKLDREHALDYQVSRAGWVGDYVDPNTFLDMYTSWSTQNDTGWTSPEYDQLIKAAGTEFDATKRMDYLHQAETMLMDQMPIMPIYFYTKAIMQKPYLVNTVKVANREISLVYADIADENK